MLFFLKQKMFMIEDGQSFRMFINGQVFVNFYAGFHSLIIEIFYNMCFCHFL